MNVTPANVLRLIWETLSDPAVAGRKIVGLQLGLGSVGEAIILVAAVSVVFSGLQQLILPLDTGGGAVLVISPFGYAAVQIGAMVLVSIALLLAGRIVGGTGRIEDALALIAWLEFTGIWVGLAATLVFFLLPPFGTAVLYLGIGALFWAMVNFVNELHGLRNRAKAGFAMVSALLVLVVSLGIFLSIFNILPDAGAI